MRDRTFWGLVLLALGGILMLDAVGILAVSAGQLWPLLVLAVSLRLLVGHVRSPAGCGSRFPAGRRHPSPTGRGWVVPGLLVLVAAWSALALANNLGFTAVNAADIWRVGWPAVLILFGLALLFRRSGIYVTSCGPGRRWRGGIGDIRYGSRPWVFDNLDLSLAAGDIVVDLTTATISPGDHELTVKAGAGDVEIWLPADVDAEVRAAAGIGDVHVLGEQHSGMKPLVTVTEPAPQPGPEVKRVRIEIQLGVGDVEVRRAKG